MESSQYYIIEINTNANQDSYISFISFTAHKPKEDDEAIFTELKSNSDIILHAFELNPDTHNIVELEKVSSIIDAEEAVEFWKIYFRFLGLKQIT